MEAYISITPNGDERYHGYYLSMFYWILYTIAEWSTGKGLEQSLRSINTFRIDMIELIHDDNELVILHFKDLAIRLVDQYAYFQGEMNLKNINKNMYCKSDNNIINFTYDVHIGVESLGKILKRLTPLLRLSMYISIYHRLWFLHAKHNKFRSSFPNGQSIGKIHSFEILKTAISKIQYYFHEDCTLCLTHPIVYVHPLI